MNGNDGDDSVDARQRRRQRGQAQHDGHGDNAVEQQRQVIGAAIDRGHQVQRDCRGVRRRAGVAYPHQGVAPEHVLSQPQQGDQHAAGDQGPEGAEHGACVAQQRHHQDVVDDGLEDDQPVFPQGEPAEVRRQHGRRRGGQEERDRPLEPRPRHKVAQQDHHAHTTTARPRRERRKGQQALQSVGQGAEHDGRLAERKLLVSREVLGQHEEGHGHGDQADRQRQPEVAQHAAGGQQQQAERQAWRNVVEHKGRDQQARPGALGGRAVDTDGLRARRPRACCSPRSRDRGHWLSLPFASSRPRPRPPVCTDLSRSHGIIRETRFQGDMSRRDQRRCRVSTMRLPSRTRLTRTVSRRGWWW